MRTFDQFLSKETKRMKESTQLAFTCPNLAIETLVSIVNFELVNADWEINSLKEMFIFIGRILCLMTI